MKTLLTNILLLLLFTFSSTTEAQNQWQRINEHNGLVDNNVTCVAIANDSTYWVGTSDGLSLVKGSLIKNFNTSNSNLINNYIFDIELINDTLYAHTGAGLSRFDGVSFQNFSTSNGLLSNTLTGISSTSNGILWIGTVSGVSSFDGNSFTHYPTKTAYKIEVDTADRVYILSAYTLSNSNNCIEYFDGNIWTSSTFNLANSSITNPGFMKTHSGELMIIPQYASTVYKLEYPFTVSSKRFNYKKDYYLSHIRYLEKSQDNWLIGTSFRSNFLNPLLYTSSDSSAVPVYSTVPNTTTSAIETNNYLTIVGTDSGIFRTTSSFNSSDNSPLWVEFETQNIKTHVDPSSALFNVQGYYEGDFEMPKDSGVHGIYASNIIVSYKTTSSGKQVYPIDPYDPQYLPGPLSSSVGFVGNFIVKVTQSEITTHQNNYRQAGYHMPKGIQFWPAKSDSLAGVASDLAPFYDFNQNGCYDPENGDYPIIKGDQAIYWINHPPQQNNLEYHWMLYSKNKPLLNQVVFLDFEVINRSSQTLDSVKIGYWSDIDLGDFSDDLIGCDSIKNTVFGYGINTDMNYASYPPALGVRFLSDSLTNFISYKSNSQLNGMPGNDADWLNYLNSKWLNNQQLLYGGHGFLPSSSLITTNLMYSGDPLSNNSWTDHNVNGSNGSDIKFVSSMPSFSLASNARKKVSFAIGYGEVTSPNSGLDNIAALLQVLDSADMYYRSSSAQSFTYASNFNCVSQITATASRKNLASFKLFPNPASDKINIVSDKKICSYSVFDMRGKLVNTGKTNCKREVEIKLKNYSNGLHIINLTTEEGETLHNKILIIE